MKLYVYDHCPYCVKARMIFGLKDLPFEIVYVLNDDVETPTRLIGEKMVPIMETDGGAMPESMDIVHWVDANFGQRVVTGPGGNAKLAAWLEEARAYLHRLAMPRWVKAPLEEFRTPGAREYFKTKKQEKYGDFDELLKQSPYFIKQANEHLNALEPLIASPDAVNGALSEDDFHLFAALRTLSIVKGIAYPPKVDAYRKRMAQKAHVPLLDNFAL